MDLVTSFVSQIVKQYQLLPRTGPIY